jgi:pyruvate/2-oxoglutarate dehydrogenase complex dihydrolipoamide dehydrogenase (E3) component
LDAAGVRTDERGFVVVDRHMATTADGVYAAGDVTGLFPHTRGAYAMGRVAIAAALRRFRRPWFDATVIPQVVFTDPEIATVGAAEHDLTAARRARVAFLPLWEVDRAITADRTTGFVKLLAGPRPILGNLGGGRVLGATIVSQRAGELIHEPALAMRTGMFTGRLAQTVHAYPT